MKNLDPFEKDLLADYDAGALKSTSPTKADLAKFKAAATATFLKDKRINIRLSSPDLMDIQARALEEGIPYQTFIASVLHKYASGRLLEKPSGLASRGNLRDDESTAT
jgi:predicted DNA binding CopG/RHH family protein